MNTTYYDPKETALTRNRYQRISAFYDLMEVLSERRYHLWRERLWSLVEGPNVLEAGVGTGKNIPYYPEGLRITGIDLTRGMLARAQERAAKMDIDVSLNLGDVQALEFPDATFDSAVATFVFCSVPDPVLGLHELQRVVKPGGQIVLMDHVRSEQPLLGVLMDIFNPAAVRMTGANINRRTVENVSTSRLSIEHVEDLGMGDIFKLIIARREPS